MTYRKSRGFTLIELAAVMFILGIIAALTAPNIMEEINLKRASRTVQETQIVMDAARLYRAQNGSWPGGATCATAMSALSTTNPPMLVGIGAINKYKSPITTSCTAATFSVDQNIVPDWDGYVVNSLPGTTIVNAATNQVRSTIGIPGSEPALDAKLSRVATGNAELNRMRTELLLGGNNISEINNVSAQSVTAAGQISGNQVTGNSVWGNTVSGNTISGTTVWGSSVSGTNVSAGNMTTYGTDTVLGLLNAASSSQFIGDANFYNDVVLQQVVNEGWGCPRHGALARFGDGSPASCQYGVWQKVGGKTESVVANCLCPDCGFQSGVSCDPVCPAGFTLTSKVDSGSWSVTHNRHRIWVGVCIK